MRRAQLVLGCLLVFCPFARPQSSATHADNSPDNTKQRESYWHQVVKPDILPIWLGGLAALIASIVGVCTLHDIGKQTRAAVVAANAAKKSADAQINIERPWLLIEELEVSRFMRTGFDRPVQLEGKFSCAFVNYGKTPARVRALKIRLLLGESDQRPPEPTGVFDTSNFLINPHIIPQNDKRPHKTFIEPDGKFTDAEDVDIAKGRRTVWALGMVRYEDVHGGTYETRICCRYDFETEKLILDGPPKYNSAT